MQPNSNLAPQRGPSVWERPEMTGRHDQLSRIFVGAAGVAMVVGGLATRGWRGGCLTVTGGSLIALAASEKGLSGAVDWVERRLEAWRAPDLVTEASDESFPASDSPSWTPTVGITSGGRSQRQ